MPFKVTAPFILKGFFYKSCKKRVKTSKMSKEIMESTNETAPKKYIPDRGKPSLRTKVANTLSVLLMGASHMVGCTPSPSPEKTDPSSSTSPQVSVETNPDTQSETSIPAPMSTEEGSSIEITSSSYPSNEENFILNDQRTNQEKTDVIESVAPDDYQKEANLLGEEWKRMGKDESDLEIVASIVDGKSWVLVAKSKSGGQVFVPKINGVIQASLHLFGRLDETGDFFDLVPVAVEGATVVGDESGWHVVARVEGGEVVQWYDAAADEVRTVERAEPSPTPDARFQTLVPETLDLCREENTFDVQDIETINQKLEEQDIDPDTVPTFTTGIQTEDIQKLNLPASVGLVINVEEGQKLTIDFCGYYDGVYVVDIPLRRQGSDEVGHLKFAIDENAQREYFSLLGHEEWYDQYHNLENNYDRLTGKGESIKTAVVQVILYRGSAEEGGVWDPLLSFDPEKMAAGNEYTMTTNYAFFGSSDPQVAQRSWDEIQKRIVPCVSVGVIY